VLSKCANPACLARFRYLHEGRIFNIEIKAAGNTNFAYFKGRIEHFWLCDSCAQTMKVVWENGEATTRPRYLALTDGKAQVESKGSREAA
jgi:hypothetical protein